MSKQYNKIGFLSGSTLKIIACFFMLIDHVGLTFFSRYDIFRVVGRLAFPIFAFFIAEGCRYSKHKLRRFVTIFSIGIAFFLFYYIYDDTLYGNIFLTFSVSIILDSLIFQCKKHLFPHFKLLRFVCFLAVTATFVAILYHIYGLIHFEYGFFGMLLPVLINLTNFRDTDAPLKLKAIDTHLSKIILLIIGSVFVSLNGNMGNMQFFCLVSVPFLVFYNGKPGCKKLKYVFYVFYPAHLIVIEAIALAISLFK